MNGTCKQMMPAIGTKILVRFEEIRIDAIVEDVKSSYGRPRLLIKPIAGFGTQWVELGRVVNLPVAASTHLTSTRYGG